MIRNILHKYWGYSSFRPLQEEIILSVLEGKDTLALLPTGGGKSICFQVPTLSKEGICLVVSPLIALMKDQVENLKKRGIKAERITSDLRSREIDIILDNCIYGDIKFLYVSPERLVTEVFIERVKKMNVSLIAVDEAHCVSQWGYDFRPPYLLISDLRKWVDAPVLALTATATPEVVTDIQEKLLFKTPCVFQGSYIRDNLTYVVLEEENKYKKLLDICSKVNGTGIIYASTRKRTKEIADFLIQNKISASFFHAGLTVKIKNKRQEDWMSNTVRIIVSTNAFGMGIDKPDVRFVVHMDIPNNPESYFQEAGRAGRDGKRAWAVLIYNKQDIQALDFRVESKFPPLHVVRKMYRAMCNHLQIAIGFGKETSHNFFLHEFISKYNFKSVEAYNSLKLLEQAGYITLGEAFYNPSRVLVVMNRKDLYSFQIQRPELENMIKFLLRSFDGIFDVFVKIDENDLARKLNSSYVEIKKVLQVLHKMHAIHYIPQNNLPKLFFIHERLIEDSLMFDKSIYSERKKLDLQRKNAMQEYVIQSECRSVQLVSYFGELNSIPCGKCDVCLERKKNKLSDQEITLLEDEIENVVAKGIITIEELKGEFPKIDSEKLLQVVRWLVDVGRVERNEHGAFLKKK